MKTGFNFNLKRRVNDGLTYEAYSQELKLVSEMDNPELLDKSSREMFHYLKLNYQRSVRIYRMHVVSPEMQQILKEISQPQIWMLLTENWCGDSAQSLPIIAKMASGNPLINFKILYRDKNPDIMERYLTAGTRSIPKLVAFTSQGKELFRWGPRPRDAARLYQSLKENGVEQREL